VRGISVLMAAAAAWCFVGLPTPPVPAPRLRPRTAALGLVSGIGGAGLALGIAGNGAVAGAVGTLTAVLPPVVERERLRAAAERDAARWPDFLAALRGRLATGESLPEATIEASGRAGGRISGLSSRIADSAPTAGYSGALSEARSIWSDPLADRVLTTLGVAHQVGGHRVAEVLSTLGASVSDELRLRRAHHAALTQQRLTAAVALVAPWVLLLLTTATNPQAVAAYSTPTGTLVICGGLVATTAGFWLARRSARLSRQPRVFE
jgi:tight adherence protein B